MTVATKHRALRISPQLLINAPANSRILSPRVTQNSSLSATLTSYLQQLLCVVVYCNKQSNIHSTLYCCSTVVCCTASECVSRSVVRRLFQVIVRIDDCLALLNLVPIVLLRGNNTVSQYGVSMRVRMDSVFELLLVVLVWEFVCIVMGV